MSKRHNPKGEKGNKNPSGVCHLLQRKIPSSFQLGLTLVWIPYGELTNHLHKCGVEFMRSRIYEYYSTYKKLNCQERSIASLTNRWSIIQKCLNKFCGSLAQVEGMHPSGATEQDKIDKAKILYRENLKHNFTMDNCWNLLRHQPKWQAHMDLIKKKNGSSSGITPNSIPLGEEMENVPVDCERPPGKKAEKVREKERKCNERQNLVIKEALSQMTDDRRTCMMERRESQLKYENERSELLFLKKIKLD
ncbi:glutathione S-transferase T3-like [Carya illinoinensis]|uniref:glutathione S-transferase T3-like n=1 Tax=Carya illinoinensis TaxID=32201 RepID=UPI001C729065|nr:glutathione S-transferase T3-like [Carya illinoinensis]